MHYAQKGLYMKTGTTFYDNMNKNYENMNNILWKHKQHFKHSRYVLWGKPVEIHCFFVYYKCPKSTLDKFYILSNVSFFFHKIKKKETKQKQIRTHSNINSLIHPCVFIDDCEVAMNLNQDLGLLQIWV